MPNTNNEILIEDMQEGDVVEFLGYVSKNTTVGYKYTVGKRYTVMDDNYDIAPIDDDGEYGAGASAQDSFRFKLIERNGKVVGDFTKADLKDGMVVTLRDGSMCYVCGNRLVKQLCGVNWASVTSISELDENMKDVDSEEQYDIMKVEYMGETIWQREPEQCPKQKQLDELYKRIDELKAKADMIKGGV